LTINAQVVTFNSEEMKHWRILKIPNLFPQTPNDIADYSTSCVDSTQFALIYSSLTAIKKHKVSNVKLVIVGKLWQIENIQFTKIDGNFCFLSIYRLQLLSAQRVRFIQNYANPMRVLINSANKLKSR
jgi:hypothetical protein